MKLGLFLTSIFFCSSLFAQADINASIETRALFQRLDETSLSLHSQQKIIIGQQNAFTEKRGWRITNNDLGSELTSDMHDVANIHPGLFGLDFNEFGSWNREALIEKINQNDQAGGIFTLSWHMPTLINDGRGNNSFNDTTAKVVKHILPGGKAHQLFKTKLDSLVTFLKKINNVPVIFRPFHEHNASWFWWGKKHCSVSEYIQLWRFTIDYLRRKGVHNLLIAYSPNHISPDYFERYPGSAYVDILGVDMYFKNRAIDIYEHGLSPLGNWKKNVLWLLSQAEKKNKIPAVTEFGQEGSWYENFWTDYMSWPLEKKGLEQILQGQKLPKRGVAYMMLWRNDKSDPKHFFGPVRGHMNNNNFEILMDKNIYLGLP